MKKLLLIILPLLNICAQAKEINFLKCGSSEKTIFSCQVKTKRALVCQTRNGSGEFRYRYGTPKKIEIELPATAPAPLNYFRLASHPTPGGTITYIHFINRGYDYYLLDDASKLSDGSFSPFSKIIIFKEKTVINNLICENDDAEIDEQAYADMHREHYTMPNSPR